MSETTKENRMENKIVCTKLEITKSDGSPNPLQRIEAEFSNGQRYAMNLGRFIPDEHIEHCCKCMLELLSVRPFGDNDVACGVVGDIGDFFKELFEPCNDEPDWK
jgi:hypothetical protein